MGRSAECSDKPSACARGYRVARRHDAVAAEATPPCRSATRLIPVVTLDRMAIEEAGPNPDSLAAAIHLQLEHQRGAVPVTEIAAALDIVEIRKAPLQSMEGAVVMTPDRNVGLIVVNSASSLPRRRYTVGHELLHFLNVWHRPESPDQFLCSKADLATSWRTLIPSGQRHRLQEAEANRFAITLLAPRRFMLPYLRGVPDLAKMLNLVDALVISREAGARRYVELHGQPCGVIFGRDGVVRYAEAGPAFHASIYRHCATNVNKPHGSAADAVRYVAATGEPSMNW